MSPQRRAPNPYRRPDAQTRKAKAAGYPARSVYKLEEIDRRVKLFRAGQRVLDLGAAPGSWSMYASAKIGPKGQLLAVDLQNIPSPLGPNAKFLQGDALALSNDDLSLFAPYDVVLSDMAPSTSGQKGADQARSLELFLRAVEVAVRHSTSKGSFVGKIFMGPEFEAARAALRSSYREVRTIRPASTRSVSSELFLVGLGFTG